MVKVEYHELCSHVVLLLLWLDLASTEIPSSVGVFFRVVLNILNLSCSTSELSLFDLFAFSKFVPHLDVCRLDWTKTWIRDRARRGSLAPSMYIHPLMLVEIGVPVLKL